MDARTRLKAEAHVVDRLLDLLRCQVDEADAEAVRVSLDAFVDLGLIDRARADTYRAALTAPRVKDEAWPPLGLRDRATRYVDSLFAALGEAPDAAALSHASSALDALKDVGAISFEQWGEWFGRFLSYGADVEGLYAGGQSGGIFLMTSEDDSDTEEAVLPPEVDFQVFEARDLVRVVTGPFHLNGGPTLTSVELYEDGLRLNWHGMRDHTGQPPILDHAAGTEGSLAAHEQFRSFFWPYTIESFGDDAGTEYRETGGSGGGWNIHRPRLIMASSGFTPAVPSGATRLEIQLERLGEITVPLTPA